MEAKYLKVLVAERIADKGVEKLREAGLDVDFNPTIKRDELLKIIGEYLSLIHISRPHPPQQGKTGQNPKNGKNIFYTSFQ